MIAGVVNDSLELVVQIGLMRAGETTRIPAVVDTGFSGDLCLSRDQIEAMDLGIDGNRWVESFTILRLTDAVSARRTAKLDPRIDDDRELCRGHELLGNLQDDALGLGSGGSP